MIVLGIDPGSEQSGVVLWDSEMQTPKFFDQHVDNKLILTWQEAIIDPHSGMPVFPMDRIDLVAIERIRGYGIVAGDDTFDTCEWVGRFDLHFRRSRKRRELLPRKVIKRELCGNVTTNDKYVRQALIDRIGEVGTKKNRGKLYGIAGHCWSALAVAVVACDIVSQAKPQYSTALF